MAGGTLTRHLIPVHISQSASESASCFCSVLMHMLCINASCPNPLWCAPVSRLPGAKIWSCKLGVRGSVDPTATRSQRQLLECYIIMEQGAACSTEERGTAGCRR